MACSWRSRRFFTVRTVCSFDLVITTSPSTPVKSYRWSLGLRVRPRGRRVPVTARSVAPGGIDAAISMAGAAGPSPKVPSTETAAILPRVSVPLERLDRHPDPLPGRGELPRDGHAAEALLPEDPREPGGAAVPGFLHLDGLDGEDDLLPVGEDPGDLHPDGAPLHLDAGPGRGRPARGGLHPLRPEVEEDLGIGEPDLGGDAPPPEEGREAQLGLDLRDLHDDDAFRLRAEDPEPLDAGDPVHENVVHRVDLDLPSLGQGPAGVGEDLLPEERGPRGAPGRAGQGEEDGGHGDPHRGPAVDPHAAPAWTRTTLLPSRQVIS
jgi:hypothetical protein